MTNKIIVRLNPDVPPTGSDLGIVNAAPLIVEGVL